MKRLLLLLLLLHGRGQHWLVGGTRHEVKSAAVTLVNRAVSMQGMRLLRHMEGRLLLLLKGRDEHHLHLQAAFVIAVPMRIARAILSAARPAILSADVTAARRMDRQINGAHGHARTSLVSDRAASTTAL